MYVSAVSTVLNIALDYCMIFGKFGFARMEIKGAALATAVSAWVGFVLLLVISFAEKNIIIAKLSEVFRITPQDIKYYFRKAIPVILNETLWGGGTFVFNLIFSNMGYEYYASITILKTFENLAYVFFIGLCSACSVMIGKSVGRGLISRGVDDSKRFLILVPIYAVVLGGLSIIFRSQLVSIFDMGNNISELTISTAKTIMVIYSIELPARTLCFTFIVGILRSGGDTVTAARYDLSSLWLVSLPITLITAYVIKAPFVVCYAVMLVAEDYFKIIMCTRHYVKLRWIKPVTEEGRQGLKDYIEERQAKKLG
jgi:Na+-driven multidrug efflux pump